MKFEKNRKNYHRSCSVCKQKGHTRQNCPEKRPEGGIIKRGRNIEL